MSSLIPEGYKKDALERLVPISTIAQIDLDRDELIEEIFNAAEQLQQTMLAFKMQYIGDIEAFVELAGEKYGAKLGGEKGNISLLSFDGSKKVEISIGETIHFDERLQVAKSLINECITEWSEGVNDFIKLLVNQAFSVNKEGKINVGNVINLTRAKGIDHPKWNQAMQAIKDSQQVISSKNYIRLYSRANRNEKMKLLSLNMASISEDTKR